MQEKSNARFLGFIISDPLRIVGTYKSDEPAPPVGNYEPSNFDLYGVQPLEILEGDAPEPDPEELPDQDWAGQPTEYDPS